MFYDREYSSGDSMSLSTSWGSQGQASWPPAQAQAQHAHAQHARTVQRPPRKAASVLDLMMQRRTVQDAMDEFRANGSDSPYEPDNRQWNRNSAYRRQWSCPQPARAQPAPAPPPPAQPARTAPPALRYPRQIPDEILVLPPPPGFAGEPVPMRSTSELNLLTAEQRQALGSLFMYSLLEDMKRGKGDQLGADRAPKKREYEECRFCRNNGERADVCHSHSLKDARGRVCCPILRAYTCRRCGATGDRAHTLKYCPFSTSEDRITSVALMRSIRKGSAQRRYSSFVPDDFVVFGEASPSLLEDNIYSLCGDQAVQVGSNQDPYQLDPQWAELEKKLILREPSLLNDNIYSLFGDQAVHVDPYQDLQLDQL